MRSKRKSVERSTEELEFQDVLKLELGAHPSLRWWRQNSGVIPVRDDKGKVLRYFHAGPPTGACDLSGIIRPEGWRLEVELKSSKGTRSPEQILWGEMVERFGGVYVLVAHDPSLSFKESARVAARIILAAIEARRARA